PQIVSQFTNPHAPVEYHRAKRALMYQLALHLHRERELLMNGTNQEPRPKKKSIRAQPPARSGGARRRTLLEVEALEARVMPTVVTIAPSKDNTLYQSATGALSNGAGPTMFAGTTNATGGNAIRRGVIAFNVAGSVPAGATINGVTLTLAVDKTIAGVQTVQLHALLA